jgi:hypothetical protein
MIEPVTLFVYTVAAFGLAYVLGHAVITQGIREALYQRGALLAWLVILLECPACCGFWTGWFASLVFMVPPWDLSWPSLRVAGAAALYTAGSNFLLGRATKLVGHPRGES